MGILAALTSALFITAKDTISKQLGDLVHPTTSTCASFIYALPWYFILLLGLWLLGVESFVIGQNFLLFVCLRALTDSAAEWLKMSALSCGELSIVSLFFSLSPIILIILSPLLTGDSLQPQDLFGVLIVTVGCIIAAYRPGVLISRNTLRPILFSLGAAVFFALNSCFDRLAVQQSSAAFSGFTMTVLSGLFFLPRVLFSTQMRQEFFLYRRPFSLRGLLEVAFMVLKLLALQYLPAPQVIALQRISIPLSVLSGKLFFGEKQIVQRLIGAAVILFGVVIAL